MCDHSDEIKHQLKLVLNSVLCVLRYIAVVSFS